MSRYSFTATVHRMAREAARVERARQQAVARDRAAGLRAVRDAERQSKADAKEAARQYIADREWEADEMSLGLVQRERAIETLLVQALTKSPAIDLLATQKKFVPNHFAHTPWNAIAPVESSYMPPALGVIARLLPGAAQRQGRRIEQGKRQFEAPVAHHGDHLAARDAALMDFNATEAARKAAVDAENVPIIEAHRALLAGEHKGIINYFELVLANSLNGEPDALSAEIGYSTDSKHLVVDLELPDFDVIPEESGFRFVKAADRIDASPRPLQKRKTLYSHLLSQIALKCVDVIFRASPPAAIECVTLNGMLDTIDPATGQQVRVCLLSVRVTADTFRSLNLGQVQTEHCLRSLKASVSRSPTELLAVRPLVELDMVDPRFVETMDIMSGLDTRPNLMELTPTEFEGLITNLFGTMGLDTRQTRPSRDGGVDCVAFDPRPVFGGKVVIQAKRYKNTVGVSAVRDLFGTLQNEGASKGILVTTSGYGKAAYDFAKGKPLELLDGGNLLHLLAEHADVDARIVMPDGWTDLPIHGE